MKLLIRRISPPSLAAILGAIHLILGCVGSCFIIINTVFGLQFTMHGPISWSIPTKLSLGPAIGLALAYPILCALVGVIAGFIMAWLYNFVCRFLKGLLIEVDQGGPHDD